MQYYTADRVVSVWWTISCQKYPDQSRAGIKPKLLACKKDFPVNKIDQIIIQ